MDRSQHAFLGVAALLFAASAAVTVVWCGSMSAMGGMEMPGDWTMSMAWMRMPGQSWSGATSSFLGMWGVMMMAMMLPSLVPMLARYRRAVCCVGQGRLGRLTTLAGLGYFSVWMVFGAIAFPLGVALATMTMQVPALARAVPTATAMVVLIAGALQFSAWKARHLACCRGASGEGVNGARAGRGALDGNWSGSLRRLATTRPGYIAAWQHGARLGFHCVYCCSGLTAILLVMGVMDLRAMAVVAVAITFERLAPAGERVARIIGAVVIVAGFFLLARAVAMA